MFQISFKDISESLLILWNISKMAIFITVLITWILSSSAFLPPVLLEYLDVVEIVIAYHLHLSVAFIITSLILSFSFAYIFTSRRKNKQIQKQFKRDIKEKIRTLTYKERVYLREFFLQRQDIVFLDIEDPIVMGLLQKDIIGYTIGEGYFNFKPLQIAEPFKIHITHDVVGMSGDLRTLSKERMAKIQRERPKCVAMYKRLREN